MRSKTLTIASWSVALALVIAACGDGDSGEQRTEGTTPAVGLAIMLSNPEGRQVYVGAFPSIPTGTVTTAGMAEFGNVYTSIFEGHFYVWDRDSYEVKKLGFTDDQKVIELGRLSFAAYGSGFEFGNAFTAPNRGLIPHVPSGQLIVWDPQAMVITGTQPLNMPKREGLDTFSGDPVVAAGHVVWPLTSMNEEAGKLYPKMAALIAPADGSASPTLIEDDRCLSAIQGFSTQAGDAYLIGDGYTGNSNYWLKDVSNPPPACILRVRNGATTFDPTYLLNLNTVTGSPAIAQNFRIDDNRVLLRVWDPATPLAPIDGYWSSMNFVSKVIDLSRPEAMATDFAALPKGGATSNVQTYLDGSAYVEIPKSDTENEISQLQADKIVPAFTIQGGLWSFGRLR